MFFFFFSSCQYKVDNRKRQMEDKREKLQQLIRKKKDEQSKCHMSSTLSRIIVVSHQRWPLDVLSLSHRVLNMMFKKRGFPQHSQIIGDLKRTSHFSLKPTLLLFLTGNSSRTSSFVVGSSL